jgi:hypothetical protein
MVGIRTLAEALRGGVAPGRFHLRRDVVVDEFDEKVLLTDPERMQFFALDRDSAWMLARVLEHGLEAAARRIAAEYGEPEDRVRDDLQELLRDLRRNRMIVPTESSPRPAQPPGRFRVMLLLTAAWTCLRLLGWSRTIRLWRRPEGRVEACELDRATILQVDRAVQDAAAGHLLNLLLNHECKEKALVAQYLLRSLGLPAELVVGVVPRPFESHAWAICDGQIVASDPVHCRRFHPVVRF